MSRIARAFPLCVTLLLAACTESLDPLEPQGSQLGRVSGEGVMELRPLPHPFTAFRSDDGQPLPLVALSDANAAVLDSYELTFWVVRGEPKTVEVYYVDEGGREEGRFLRLHVPAQGLARLPDGTSVMPGDSVAITLSIDRSTFLVEFAPSGLQFSEFDPAQIEMWYTADVNGTSAAHNLTYWRRQEFGEPWYPLWSDHDGTARRIKTLLFHFSGYAVAWDH